MSQFSTSLGAVGGMQQTRPLNLPLPNWWEQNSPYGFEMPQGIGEQIDRLTESANLRPGAAGSLLDVLLSAIDKITKQGGQNIKNILGNNGVGGAATDLLNSLLSSNPLLIPILGVGGVILLIILIKT